MDTMDENLVMLVLCFMSKKLHIISYNRQNCPVASPHPLLSLLHTRRNALGTAHVRSDVSQGY